MKGGIRYWWRVLVTVSPHCLLGWLHRHSAMAPPLAHGPFARENRVQRGHAHEVGQAGWRGRGACRPWHSSKPSLLRATKASSVHVRMGGI